MYNCLSIRCQFAVATLSLTFRLLCVAAKRLFRPPGRFALARRNGNPAVAIARARTIGGCNGDRRLLGQTFDRPASTRTTNEMEKSEFHSIYTTRSRQTSASLYNPTRGISTGETTINPDQAHYLYRLLFSNVAISV